MSLELTLIASVNTLEIYTLYEERPVFSKLDSVEGRFEELTSLMGDQGVASDPKRYQEVARQRAGLEPTVVVWRRFKQLTTDLEESKALLGDDDPEMREMAKAEIETVEAELKELEEQLKILLLPKDPNDEKNVVLEIRAGTGGDEATLFAADLLRMYTRYSEQERWRIETISSSGTEVGGFKEVILLISGDRVYSKLKFESGVHRVQRVPSTESQGRIHTSAASVAVLPEADEVELNLQAADYRVDYYRSSGPGGQSVNTTDSAVRLTHIATGLIVTCQDEKSQHKNKAKALKVLASRLLELEQKKAHDEQAGARKAMVGSGDRSERIRTYNYPQNRVTDHRVGLTLYKLDTITEGGGLGEVVDACTAFFNAELLKEQQQG